MMNEESLSKEYQSALKAIAVCNDIRVMQRYMGSRANEWEAYKQCSYTFDKFLKDEANDELGDDLYDPYTPLDIAVSERLFKLYTIAVGTEYKVSPYYESQDARWSSLDEKVESFQWELYDLLREDNLVAKFPQFKRYT